MTMILQLLLAAVTMGRVLTQTPPYMMYSSELGQAIRTLAVNVISMEDHIPLLNDSRRQYTEIIHVIITHGILRSGCGVDDFYKEYYQFLNNSSPEAISNPERVIDKLKELLDEVHNNTVELLKLTTTCTVDNCDEVIDKIVRDQPGKYSFQLQVFIAAGETAIQLNALNEKFEEVSRDLRANQYLLQSPADLVGIVNAVARLHHKMHPSYC